MAKTPTLYRRILMGLGLRAMAADSETKPEELAEAAAAMAEKESEAKDDGDSAGDCKDCGMAKDRCKCTDRSARDSHMKRLVKDSAAVAHRTKMHAALDRMLDEHEEGEGEVEATDADIEELKGLLGEFLTEEEKEPEHAKDSRSRRTRDEGAEDPDDEGEHEDGEVGDEADEESEVIEPVGDEDEEEEEETVPANDSFDALVPVYEKTRDTKFKEAFRKAPVNDEAAFLKAIRPAVARSKDGNVRRAFDTAVDAFSKASRVSRDGDSGYAAFARGASARATDSKAMNPEAAIEELNRAYAAARGKDISKA